MEKKSIVVCTILSAAIVLVATNGKKIWNRGKSLVDKVKDCVKEEEDSSEAEPEPEPVAEEKE